MAMKKIKVSEATGPVLDWMVAVCQWYAQGGNEVAVAESGDVIIRRNNVIDYFDPHRNWGWGGPIIDGMRGLKLKIGRKPGAPCYAHIVGYNGVERWHQTGKTVLIAAMRCYVASKLGDEVEVPEELL